jgi:hypothetical protein
MAVWAAGAVIFMHPPQVNAVLAVSFAGGALFQAVDKFLPCPKCETKVDTAGWKVVT